MNETGTEKVAPAVTVACSLIAGEAVLVACLLIVVGSLAGARPAFAQTAPAGIRLEAGIAKEEVDGDLKSAMEVYQGIAADSSAPRDVRAKALLRLAGCYEKLGRQARQVYERIVRDYAEQPAASQARTRLASIAQREHPTIPATMTVRRIDQAPLGELIATDTDGQRVIYRDDTGSIFIGDLTGHPKRVVYRNEQKHEDWPGFIPSRDLSMVVVFSRSKVGVMQTDGSGYHEVFRNDPRASYPETGYPNMCCRWSWDKRHLLIPTNTPGGGGRLLIVTVADGERRELLSLGTGRFAKAVFSPDGRFVAYEVTPQLNEVGPLRIFVVPSKGGAPHLVYESVKRQGPLWPVQYALMDWTADGRYLIIAENRYGKIGLYLYPMRSGLPAGAPVLVRYGDIKEGQTTPTGAFVYEAEKESGNGGVQIAPLDSDGRIGSWRRAEIRRASQGYSSPSFSPDARNIAYSVNDDWGASLVLHDLSTGQERELYHTFNSTLLCHYAARSPKVFCTVADKRANTQDLISIAVDSGQVDRLGSTDNRSLLQPSHDDRYLYLAEPKATCCGGRMFRWDFATGQQTVVSTESPEFSFDEPSLDDRWLVRSSSKSGVLVRPISGGDWTHLASYNLSGFTTLIATTPDGKWVIYSDSDNDKSGKPCLFRVPVAGGPRERLADFQTINGYGALRISPDGRQILAVNYDPAKDDLWVLDNFVPSASEVGHAQN